MRTLLHIPVIHTQADLGELASMVKESAIKEQGYASWIRKIKAIDKFWDAVEEYLMNRNHPQDCGRIYQDGLPLCGRELEIVQELAATGSRNHRLILKLIDKGSLIMGTESPELLLQEYHFIKLGQANKTETGEEAQGGKLLERRDRFIGGRINTSLGPGESGVLFLGMLHRVRPYLDLDIELIEFTPPICDI